MNNKPITPQQIQTEFNAVVFRWGRVCENGISYHRLCELLSPYHLDELLTEHRVAEGPVEVVLVAKRQREFSPVTPAAMMQISTSPMFDVDMAKFEEEIAAAVGLPFKYMKGALTGRVPWNKSTVTEINSDIAAALKKIKEDKNSGKDKV